MKTPIRQLLTFCLLLAATACSEDEEANPQAALSTYVTDGGASTVETTDLCGACSSDQVCEGGQCVNAHGCWECWPECEHGESKCSDDGSAVERCEQVPNRGCPDRSSCVEWVIEECRSVVRNGVCRDAECVPGCVDCVPGTLRCVTDEALVLCEMGETCSIERKIACAEGSRCLLEGDGSGACVPRG